MSGGEGKQYIKKAVLWLWLLTKRLYKKPTFVVIGISVFFKVEQVVVYGNDAYSAWTIQEASGIEGGENLLSFGRTRACGKIITALPYVKTVRIGIKLPDTVNIEVVESDVTYAIQAEDNGWWFISSQGRVLEMTTGIIAEYFTKIEGVKIMIPAIGQQAVAASRQAETIREPSAGAAAATGPRESAHAPPSASPCPKAAECRLSCALCC